MPTCKKCKGTFPNRKIIDGRIRNLQRRRYCLNCSSFGSKNTKQLHVFKVSKQCNCTCLICGKEYQYSRKRGDTKSKCSSCKTNQRRFEIKERAVKYKGGCCSRCGYDKCIKALTFHHKDPSKKDFQISGNHSRKWKVIKKELDKCILVCSNCHIEIHDEMGLWRNG